MPIKGIFGHIGKRLPIYERGQGSEAGLNYTLSCPKQSRENVLPYNNSPHASNSFNFKSGMTYWAQTNYLWVGKSADLALWWL